jgi:hypothetical protein
MSFIYGINLIFSYGTVIFFSFWLVCDVVLFFADRKVILMKLINKNDYYNTLGTNKLFKPHSLVALTLGYFYNYLITIFRNPNRMIFLEWHYRLLMVFWIWFISLLIPLTLVFRFFWFFYWLVKVTRAYWFNGLVVEPKRSREDLIPDNFLAVKLTYDSLEDFHNAVKVRRSIIIHFVEIIWWLSIKVPYYRMFNLVFKLCQLLKTRTKTPSKSNRFLIQQVNRFFKIFLKVIIFKLILHIPWYVANLAYKFAIAFNSVEGENYDTLLLKLSAYLNGELIYGLIFIEEITLIGRNKIIFP